MSSSTVSLNLNLDEELNLALRLFCDNRRVTKSDGVRLLLATALEQFEARNHDEWLRGFHDAVEAIRQSVEESVAHLHEDLE